MSNSPPFIFLCNGADVPTDLPHKAVTTRLSYLQDDPNHVVSLYLPRFVDSVYHLPPRILDLLEIAAYVFVADRCASRGPKDALEYHAWARSFRFVVRVRDCDFWSRTDVSRALSDALVFMTGDREYTFDFEPGHQTPPTSLFDRDEFTIGDRGPTSVVLFSGGLDSLAGVVQRLKSTNENLYLISHRSGQPSTKHTQRQLVAALEKDYPGRIHHYSFECHMAHKRAVEETQRTRAFLFGSIAFALAHRLSQDRFFAYENGITSLNLSRRQDLMNARASRTTHPKTHTLMARFLSEIHGSSMQILNPFSQCTKTDVFELLDQAGGRNLIGSTVSCSKTFQHLGVATHCGCCFQCIDRSLAAYASGLHKIDDCGIYSKNVFVDSIDDPEARTTAVDYVRQATSFAKSSVDDFYYEHLNELGDVVDCIGANTEQDAIEQLWKLCKRHGSQVVAAIKRAQQDLDDPCMKTRPDSLLHLVADREHLKDDPQRLAESISAILRQSLPMAFKTRRPSREDEVNDQIAALLRAKGDAFRREFPSTTFALAKIVPDHEAKQTNLLIEAKYIRKGTSPSKASEGIAADITKYQANKFILFVVYDPERGIADDAAFRQDIESKRACLVAVVR
jgi:7-cyano-7-deazaguanine synthase in queuosine biosynthesis